MSKMTDKEITKALECCIKSSNFGECFENKCPFVSENGCKVGKETLYPYVLDLINRQQGQLDNYSHNVRNMSKDFIEQYKIIREQQAEIEKLTINMNAFGLGMKREKERADTIRVEAIKEFADRLKEHLKGYGGLYCVTTMNAHIDNLVKEMGVNKNDTE